VRFLTKRPPYSVMAYAAFAVTIVVVSLSREGPHERLLGGALVLMLATFALLQGLWVAWLFLTAVAVGDMIIGLLDWPSWTATSTIVINGVMLALLVAGPTRRYARRGRPRALARLGFGG
jgi:hypothetical protein